jgi:polyhydroxyalkanoate synthesis regulator phasin
MAHLVETGKLSLEDVRELESDLLRQDEQPKGDAVGGGSKKRTERKG